MAESLEKCRHRKSLRRIVHAVNTTNPSLERRSIPGEATIRRKE